jgi:hypothetical protein
VSALLSALNSAGDPVSKAMMVDIVRSSRPPGLAAAEMEAHQSNLMKTGFPLMATVGAVGPIVALFFAWWVASSFPPFPFCRFLCA